VLVDEHDEPVLVRLAREDPARSGHPIGQQKRELAIQVVIAADTRDVCEMDTHRRVARGEERQPAREAETYESDRRAPAP